LGTECATVGRTRNTNSCAPFETAPADECRAADPRTLGTNELEKLIELSNAIATAAAMRSDLFSLPAWAARRWEQVDLKTATLHVRRVKNGKPPVFSP
jgi:hypothetical protein